MGRTVSHLTSLFVTYCFVAKILPSDAQASLSQYLQLAGFGTQSLPLLPGLAGSPSSYQLQNPNYGAHPSNYQPPSYQTPSYQSNQVHPNSQSTTRSNPSQPNPLPVPLTSVANLAASIPDPKPPPQKAPVVPKISESLPTAGLDSNVLNNLAIALQLLIVSNILNTPPVQMPEPLPKLELPLLETLQTYESAPITPLTLSYPVHSSMPSLQSSVPFFESPRPQNMYSYESQNVPKANFLGSSGFSETSSYGSTISARPNPRSSMTLMSPYEALGPSSPFSDPILSSAYSPSYSKKDFQSPYASILAAEGHRDLFSLADLF